MIKHARAQTETRQRTFELIGRAARLSRKRGIPLFSARKADLQYINGVHYPEAEGKPPDRNEKHDSKQERSSSSFHWGNDERKR